MRKYLLTVVTQFNHNLTYLVSLVFASTTIAIFMWVAIELWTAAYVANGNKTLEGLTLLETVWYLLLAEILFLSRSNVVNTISQDVKSGAIAYYLNKPINYLFYQFCVALSNFGMFVILNSTLGIITVVLMVGPPPSYDGILFFIVAGLLGFFMDFCVLALIGLSSFIIEDASSFLWIYSKLLLILGGTLMPIEFFPESIKTILDYLPFSQMIYAPAKLMIHPSLSNFIELVTFQSLWLALFFAALFYYYKFCNKKICINGG